MPIFVGKEADRFVEKFPTRADAVIQRDILKETYKQRDLHMQVVILHVRTTREILDEESSDEYRWEGEDGG